MSRDPRDRIPPNTTAKELQADLEGALRFITQRVKGNSAKAARARAIEVVDLLTRHLRELGIEPSLLRPLDDIYLAFADAERGVLPLLFKPKALKGRPPTELAWFWVMMKAALAIDLLIAAKRTREAAAKQVVKELRKYGVPVEGNGKEWKTVLRWREDLAKAGRGGGRHNKDWTWYGGFYLHERDDALRLIREEKSDPEALAKRQLDLLRRDLPSFG